MKVELDAMDLETLVTSLEYSILNVSNAQDTPLEVRRENLERIESVMKKIREARRQGN